MARAASGMSRNMASAIGRLAGLTSTAIREALGTRSWKSPSRLAITSCETVWIPVALPPGRARLATRPSLTGSSPTPKTIGIVAVAALAASRCRRRALRQLRLPNLLAGQTSACSGSFMDVDFSSQDYFRNPAAAINKLRSAGSVVEVRFPILGRIWTTTTQEMADRVLKDSEAFSMRWDDGNIAGVRWWMPGIVRTLANHMLSMDEPDHRRLRDIVDEASAVAPSSTWSRASSLSPTRSPTDCSRRAYPPTSSRAARASC